MKDWSGYGLHYTKTDFTKLAAISAYLDSWPWAVGKSLYPSRSFFYSKIFNLLINFPYSCGQYDCLVFEFELTIEESCRGWAKVLGKVKPDLCFENLSWQLKISKQNFGQGRRGHNFSCTMSKG